MRLRIENKKLGFKITESELNQLTGGQVLVAHALIRVHLAPLNEGESNLVLRGNTLIFQLEPKHIQALADMGRNRDGISIKFSDVTAIVQVDIRSDSRSACQP